jgi:alkylated DNA repair dioxygenase AlkB
MRIRGLTHTPAFVTASEEHRLIDAIDGGEWIPHQLRRVQHFGYVHDPEAQSIDSTIAVGELPRWVSAISARLPERVNQLTVDEYQPGHGLRRHLESVRFYGDAICILTLGSSCTLTLDRIARADRHDVPLPVGSLVILESAARFFFRHGISARRSDVIDGRAVKRTRLITLTFRRVLTSRLTSGRATAWSS